MTHTDTPPVAEAPSGAPHLTSDTLLTQPIVSRRVGDPSRATLYRWMRAGHFPRAVRIGGKSYWSEREIDQWIVDRLAERATRG
jgi:predicted DNA-binding transcriptional regulator AlpA